MMRERKKKGGEWWEERESDRQTCRCGQDTTTAAATITRHVTDTFDLFLLLEFFFSFPKAAHSTVSTTFFYLFISSEYIFTLFSIWLQAYISHENWTH